MATAVRPHRHRTDDEIEALIHELRDERAYRRQRRNVPSFHAEVTRHRIGRGYGRNFQVAVMRRNARLP